MGSIQFVAGLMLGGLIVGALPKWIQRRAYRSQFYPQSWWWLIGRDMHQRGYPEWPSVRIARRLGWME
jgi:hypothetical protein